MGAALDEPFPTQSDMLADAIVEPNGICCGPGPNNESNRSSACRVGPEALDSTAIVEALGCGVFGATAEIPASETNDAPKPTRKLSTAGESRASSRSS